jgi:transcriptional regulator with XRE-family HTH domain
MTERIQLRKRAAISLRELEAKTGISRNRLNLFEHGETTLAADEVVRVAAVLGTSLNRTPVFASHETLVEFLRS